MILFELLEEGNLVCLPVLLHVVHNKCWSLGECSDEETIRWGSGDFTNIRCKQVLQWDQMKAVGEQTVEDRVALRSTHRDLFHHLGENGYEPIKPTKALVAVDGQLAIIAGEDTSATTLSHIFYFLLRHPTYLERSLRREVEGSLEVKTPRLISPSRQLCHS